MGAANPGIPETDSAGSPSIQCAWLVDSDDPPIKSEPVPECRNLHRSEWGEKLCNLPGERSHGGAVRLVLISHQIHSWQEREVSIRERIGDQVVKKWAWDLNCAHYGSSSPDGEQSVVLECCVYLVYAIMLITLSMRTQQTNSASFSAVNSVHRSFKPY